MEQYDPNINYEEKYKIYKIKYLKLKSQQIGGKNSCNKRMKKMPNANIEFEDRMKIKFSFIPKASQKDLEDSSPITYNEKNIKIFNKFFKTGEWHSQLKYLFDKLRPYPLPYYTPEMYKLSDIRTQLTKSKNIIEIVILATVEKYSYNKVKNMYDKSDALNKTWSDKINEKMKFCNFYYLVQDGFYKITNEGELIIDGLGQMNWGRHTNMILEKID